MGGMGTLGVGSGRQTGVIAGDALDLIAGIPTKSLDLVATDPPYAFGGDGAEHELSATVAVVLREAALRVKAGGHMVTMMASSWRSTSYAVEAVRGVMTPTRIGTWVKPAAKSKVRTPGWAWATVNVLVFRRGKATTGTAVDDLDWISCPPVGGGRRAELPSAVADWAVAPYATAGGWGLDPFAGSGALVDAMSRAGMDALGFELDP